MTTIRELITSWGFVVNDKAIDAVDKKMAALKTTVALVGGVAIGAAASMFGFATSAAASGAEVQRAADRIGISVEALQEYQYAARIAGQTNEGFSSSLQTLEKNLFDARRGIGSSREAFYLLGTVMGKDLLAKGLSAEEVLNNVADGLTKVTDKSRKLELASQLFGGDAGAMLTTLRNGSKGLADLRVEARETGAVMSGQATAASVQFQASLERTKSTILGLKNTIGVALFPLVERTMGSFRRWIVVNRQWLASGIHEGLATLTVFITRVIAVAERAGSVVNTTAIAFGGWQRVLKLVTTGMVLLLTMRTASFFGQLVMAIAKVAVAMRAMGVAGLAAQVEVAAIPLAIGAAFIGLLLIIEDIVAYFQGRKSITGMIVKDFAGLEGKLSAWLDPIVDRMKKWGQTIGQSIVDGIANLKAEDIGKFADTLKKALMLAFDLATIPIQIGWAIAGGIMDGLVDGLRKRFPKLASMLGLDEGHAGIATGVPTPVEPGKLFGVSPREALSWLGDKLGLGGGPQPAGAGGGAIVGPPSPAEMVRMAARMSSAGAEAAQRPAPNPAQVAASAAALSTQVFNIDASQEINVPAGTPPERITPQATDKITDALRAEYRKTQAAVAAPGPY